MTQRHKGFSLIEVAIAMVIFVIGALAILRIFPTGISLVEKSGNQQIASNSSRSVLARLDNEDAYPDATVNLDSGNWKAYDGSVIGSSKYNRTLPKDVSAGQLFNSALDRYRGISGEKVVVKNGGIPSNSFVLTQFSVDTIGAIYKEDTLENVTISDTGVLDFTNATTKSGADFTPPTTTDPPATERTFYVTYRYKTSATNPRVAGIDNEPVILGTGGTATVTSANVVAGAVEVRVKEPIDISSLITTDDKLRVGLITLPAALPTGQQLSIDYMTDWYWIVETLTPTAADDVFKRRVDNAGELVLDAGDTHKDNYRQVEVSIPFIQGRTSQRYATLVMSRGGEGQHFFWQNTASSLPPAGATLARVPMTADDDDVDYPNYRNTLREGKIGFDITDPAITGTPTPLVSPVIRVAYRTQDGWARQLSVAAKSYKPYNLASSERWRDYVWNGDNLFFQPSEAGKSVKVTYSYGVLTNQASSDNTTTELLTIGSEILPGTTMGTGSDGAVRLTITPPGTGNVVTSIISVKGASVTARTAWLTNDKYNQSLVTSMRGDS